MTSATQGQPAVEYLRALRTYAWLVLLVAVGAVAAAVAVTVRQTRVYEATCLVEYDPNPPRPLGEGVEDVAEPVSDFWASREFFETQNHIMSSRLIAERVVERLGLAHDPSFLDDPSSVGADWPGLEAPVAAELLRSRLTVEAVPSTRLVAIRVRDRDPERASLIANTIADCFIDKTIEDRMASTVTSLEWLGEQLDTLRGELDESEQGLHAFKQAHSILSVSMEDRQNLVASQLEHFSEALNTARTERIELRARLARLRMLQGADVEANGGGQGFEEFATISAIQTQLHTQLAEHEALTLRYGPQHPRIVESQQRLDVLRQQLREEIEGIVRAAEADLREATEVEAGLQSAIDDANRAGLELNLLEIEYTQLSRTRENNEKLYGIVLERTTQTDLTRMLRTTHVRIVDRALAPETPVSPRVLVNLGVGGGVGLLLGIALALLLGRLDRRIKDAKDVEDEGLPLLGIVPVINAAVEEPGSVKRRGATPAPNSQPDLVAHTHPMSAVAENCRSIRTNLMFAGEAPLKAFAVSSANPQEGKTTVTANLAISIAQSGKRVLVVDTDLRRPRVHKAFGVSGKRGLTSIIVGEGTIDDSVQHTSVPNVDVLPCGPIPPNPAELLHRERFHQFRVEAAAKYDLVLYDSPPLSAVSDAAVLAPQLDGVLIVVRAGRTTRDAIRGALRQLRDVNAHVIGGVLNGLDPRAHGAGPYYYYSAGRGGYYASTDDDQAQPPRDPGMGASGDAAE